VKYNTGNILRQVMSTEWERVNQLFHEVTECADEERADFIERAVQHDSALRHEVQSLIASHEGDKGFLEQPALGKSLFRQIEGLQRQIIDTLRTSAGKVSVGTDGMIGQLLDGKYEIEELCGRGGMGAVYRATHVGTGRRVAVKVIAPELAGDSEFIERFRREAKTIGLLRHPNIVNVTDFGVTGAGEEAQTIAYLVMEYLEGQTLAERLKNGRPATIDQIKNCSIIEREYERMKDWRLTPINEAIAILSQTCAAMDEAHRLGVLHRDLKPENIWLESAGSNGSNVKVLDFGIARLQDIIALDELKPPPEVGEPAISRQPFSITEDETLRLNYTGRQMSRFGSLMGTPKYMSPEQCRGERLDKCSDVYSLGVIAYQMLAGEPPFAGTTPELLMRHREADPAPLREKRRDIPAGVDAVVRRALAKDKNARPATAGAFAFQLQLRAEGNKWTRRQADALARKYKWEFFEIAFRMQWKGWLFSLLLLFATLKFPGMSSVTSVAVFGLLWLIIATITIWGQNATTAALTLFLEQTEGSAEQATDLRPIVAAVRRRGRDLARSAIRLIIPPLIQEELSVEAAKQRWATLKAPIRRQAAYALFRRILAFALGLTALQQILLASAFLLDRRYHYLNATGELARNVSENMYFCLLTLPIGAFAFCLGLKSAIEQSMLYGAARKALGEIPLERFPILSLQDSEPRRFRWWASWKTYAPTCAFIVLILGFHFFKLATIKGSVAHGNLYSVKAVRASGFPVRLGFLGSTWWMRQFSRHPAMLQYLIEQGEEVNVPTRENRWAGERYYGSSGPPYGIDQAASTWTPLIAALAAGSVEAARILIQHGADVHARDSFGRTPMTIAISNCPQAIKMLLASGADINEQTRFGTPILTAARHQWPFPESIAEGRVAVEHDRIIFQDKELIERNNAVKILIEKGADPNTRDGEGRNGLMLMSMESRLDKDIELTIEDRETIEPGLLWRRRERAVELIGETLLNVGCDINAADNKGRTPLMYAAIFERPAVVNLLLKRGANINAKDHSGQSAIDWARKSRNQEIMGSLYSSIGYKAITLPVSIKQ
jgi:serine/threonine protein kinase/ankyrin repeat protein